MIEIGFTEGAQSLDRAKFKCCAIVLALLLSPLALFAQEQAQFERPPIIEATQLLTESALSGPGFHVGRLVPTNGAPVDYVSWTPRIADFATALLGLRNRVLWIPAKMTPLARQQLMANGWSLQMSQQP